VFKIGEIRELIRLLDETSVAELRIESDDMKLHMKKAEPTSVQTITAPASVPTSGGAITPVVAVTSSQTPQTAPMEQVQMNLSTVPEASKAVAEENVHLITSPMVGTFYRAPAPDAPAYVEAGSKVTDKSVVCIVEAMKLMNEIEAEISGEVLEVMAENGQLVEYGQPLFKIKLA
jgi:acetyl-CoA carboxylase biotin carboxyl carrier protein